MAASMLHWLSTRDHRLMRRVNRWTPPRWMRLWMVAATRGGDGWLWYAVGVGRSLHGRSRTFPCPAGRGASRERRHRPVPEFETSLRPQTPLRTGAAFLGHTASAGSIFLPLGPHHYRVFGGRLAGHVLPGAAARTLVLRLQRGPIAHPAGHALPDRRTSRRRHRQRVGLRRGAAAELLFNIDKIEGCTEKSWSSPEAPPESAKPPRCKLAAMGARLVLVARDPQRAESITQTPSTRSQAHRAYRRSLAPRRNQARSPGNRRRRTSHRRPDQQRRRHVGRTANSPPTA